MERFKQRKVVIDDEDNQGKIKISKLIDLLNEHPYKNEIIDTFNLSSISDEFIMIDGVDRVYKQIESINKNFKRLNITAFVNDVSISESVIPVHDLSNPLPLIFNFAEYVRNGTTEHDLNCYAIYDSKNTFFDGYEMSKFANHLYKIQLGELVSHNLQYFKNHLDESKSKHQNSYRLVESDGDLFLRGITSTNQYFEYGVDFAFVIVMIQLHKDMQKNKGNRYAITSAFLSESKLELIIIDKNLKDGGSFGQVSSALVVTTNDIGQGSLNFTKIIRVGARMDEGMYLYPKTENSRENKLIITHSTSQQKAFSKINKLDDLINETEDFISNLHDIKSINKPEELRQRIYNKLNNPRSALYEIKSLRDIFNKRINDELNDFVKLIEMCNKAEELDIEYDIKEKLRYLVSDIILSRKSSS